MKSEKPGLGWDDGILTGAGDEEANKVANTLQLAFAALLELQLLLLLQLTFKPVAAIATGGSVSSDTGLA